MSEEKKPFCAIRWDFEGKGKPPTLYLAEECGQTVDEALADRRRIPDMNPRTEIVEASDWVLNHPDESPSRIVLEKTTYPKVGYSEYFTHLQVLMQDGYISSTLGHYVGNYERAKADFDARVRRERGTNGETELEM